MKRINVTMDANGHITHNAGGGVIGDHNAAQLCVALQGVPAEMEYYRLYFASTTNTLISEQLFAENNTLCYPLPDRVTRLGNMVLCQLCGYTEQNGIFTMVFKSDPFQLTLATSLPDTGDVIDTVLVNRMEELLARVQTIAEHFDLSVGTVTTLPYNSPATAVFTNDGSMHYTLHLGLPKGEKGDGDFTPGQGISIVNGEISTTPHQPVYTGGKNNYGYLQVPENLDFSDLRGRIFWITAPFTSTTPLLSICTYQNIYHTMYRYDGTNLVTNMPSKAIVEGRPMQLYVNQNGQVVYLNPNLSQSAVNTNY